MANTFKLITRDVAPATAGTPETLYTVQSGSRIIILGLTLSNVHTAQVLGTVQIVSTTTQTGQTQNRHQYYNLPKNIKLQYYGAGHQLLEESKVIIAWNTTAILEGIAANRFILLPYFNSKNKIFKKDSELILKLKNENYC